MVQEIEEVATARVEWSAIYTTSCLLLILGLPSGPIYEVPARPENEALTERVI
jgi:hypothetical protein